MVTHKNQIYDILNSGNYFQLKVINFNQVNGLFMKTDVQVANESVTPSCRAIEILKKYFPQCFDKPETDGNGNIIKEHFDTEKLAGLLSDNVEIKKEGFTLNFLGKSYARYQSNLDSETVIVPDEENDKTDSENVYIVGDNLDALQHLKYSYAEKIKCIYIDPPYNTGKEDFVYNDKFGYTSKELVEKLDIPEDEAERIIGMNGKCTHSAWLTFMYPRLSLARELLRDDGVIFISIDDNEQANLKRLCDEIFGEGNFVAQLVWERAFSPKNDAKFISSSHDYVLMYAKGIDNFVIGRLPRTEEANARYSNPDNDPRGVWMSSDISVKTYSAENDYPITTPSGKVVEPPAGRCWSLSANAFAERLQDNRIWFGPNGDGVPRIKRFLNELKFDGMAPTSILFYKDVGHSQEGAQEVVKLLDAGVFDGPKPVRLLTRLLTLANLSKDDIILDFFSGSGTTAHSVMKLNSEDGGKRKFIMVQIDEPVKKGSEAEKAGFRTIDQIGRERIRRAAEKIKSENPNVQADLEFKTYYLKAMPQNTLDKIKTFDPEELFTSDGDIVKSLGESTLLQTWQVKDGFGFNCAQQKIDIAGCTAYFLEDEKIGKYLYLLTEMQEKSIKELIRKIETFELTVDKVFVYGYSFDFNSLTSLSANLKTLKNRNPLEPIIRY